MADDESRAAHGRADVQDLGLALLALASGCIDALAFARLGGALPSAMTGNTALMALALGRGHLHDAVPPLLAFGGFLLGTAAAMAVRTHLDDRRAARRLLVVEAAVLLCAAILWQLAPRPIAGGFRAALILLAACGMGIQGMVARVTGRAGITTIVFTSTLGSIVGAVVQALLRAPHRLQPGTLRQMGAYAAYFLGALFAGLALWAGIDPIGFLPVFAVLCALACRPWPKRAD